MSNIKFTNGVLLDQSSIDGITGIDTTNILASITIRNGVKGEPYTASEDCIYVRSNENGYNNSSEVLYVNSVKLGLMATGRGSIAIPLKKGQTVTFTSATEYAIYTVFGLKK